MRRKLVVVMLGLAMAGCAQSRSAMPRGRPEAEPVGMTPVPSIHDTINRGTGPPSVRQTTLPDPSNPRWSGQVRPAGSRPEGAYPGSPQFARAGMRTSPVVTPSAGGLAQADSVRPPEEQGPRDPGQGSSPASPPQASALAGLPAGGLAPGPQATVSADSEVLPASAGALPQIDAPAHEAAVPGALPSSLPPVNETAPATIEPAVPGAVDPDKSKESAAAPPPAEAVDPLLGPSPDLMPALESPAAPTGARAPEASHSPRSSEGPETGTAGASLSPSASAPAPPSGGFALEPAPLPLTNPKPAPGDLPGASLPVVRVNAAPEPKSTETVTRTGKARQDDGLRQVALEAAPPGSPAAERNWKEAGRSAARVGDEVITLHDLVLAVKDQLKKRPPQQSLSKTELNMAAKAILAGMIERSLLTQEAKRSLKNPKQMERLMEAADKFWREEEMPPLLRRHMVDNEYQLRLKFEESGRSLEAMRNNYRQDFLAQVFLQQKMSDKLKVELPEMLKFYNDHLRDKEFDRPAQITWRELVVELGRYSSPAQARQKAESLIARLRKGQDFDALARTDSDGPTQVRAAGGLMETSPGSYAVPAVNEALESLPIGNVSSILEGPTSLHIVRVEKRRTAGPASFEEVQDEIRQRIRNEKLQNERAAFMAKLRRNTVITTIFDGTDSDPSGAGSE